MGRPRKQIAELVEEAPAEVAPLPVVVACGRCLFRVEHLPRTPNGTTILQCRRFPAAVEIWDDYWCGEYKERPYA
jgi:hypothetical protein